MDEAGETILGSYLYGDGEPHQIFDDPFWSNYMMANDGLRRQLYGRLLSKAIALVDDVNCSTQRRFPIAERFHAECPENNGLSGYALLHGTNRTVGDFLISGFAEVQNATPDGAFDLDLDLTFTFNDIVDPNHTYAMDTIRAYAAEALTAGRARDYRLAISWRASSLAEVKRDRSIVLSGYPSSQAKVIKPSRLGALDGVDEETKSAKYIESRIIQQLSRNLASVDTTSVVDRYQRVLWMFYRLSGKMSPVYISRTLRRGKLQRQIAADYPRTAQPRGANGNRRNVAGQATARG